MFLRILLFLLGLLGFLLLSFMALWLVLPRVFAVPRYHGPVSDHFDGAHFFNPNGVLRTAGPRRYLKMRLITRILGQKQAEPGWPAWVDAPPGPKPPERVSGLRVTFVNHATLLVQIDNLNILTDPQWSERASPVSWAGPKRHRAPGIRFEDLPPIDAVIVSHNHYDHMDLPTLRRLNNAFHPVIVAPLANSLFLSSKHIPSKDLDWWQTLELPRAVRLTAVPAQHFSARSTIDRNNALWGGYVLEGKGHSVYFAGDTGYASLFREIGRRFPHLTVGLIPIGAYEPRWFMKPMHLSPAEALEVQKDIGARTLIPMHYGTFKLSEEAMDDPVKDLRAAIAARKPEPHVVILAPGEGKDFE